MSEEITFLTWKWPGQRDFRSEYVNILYNQVQRNYDLPFRFVCITDEPEDLAPQVETMPVPQEAAELAHMPSVHGPTFPSCYRKLWNFSEDAKVLGPRIVSLDIDTIIPRNVTEFFSRDAEFVGWSDPRGWSRYAGGLYMLKTGARADVWRWFDPATSPGVAQAAGHNGSDQGWISYALRPDEATWGAADGAYNLKWLPRSHNVLPGVRIVLTSGYLKPWHKKLHRKYPWILEHWR